MYRVWNNEQKEMVSDFVIEPNGQILVSDDYCGSCDQGKFSTVEDELTLIRKTYLEVNSKFAYEGDIIKITDQKENEHLIMIEQEDNAFVGTFIKSEVTPTFTVVKYGFGEYEHCDYEPFDEFEYLFIIEQFLEFDNAKIIGNKFENPELLED